MNQEVIHLENVWTKFGSTVIHQDLNLTINRGNIVSLVGGSGSGKTTLLREMLGLLRPTKGKVFVLGIDVLNSRGKEKKELYTKCGVLFQQGALFSALSVMENIALPLRELRTLPESLIKEMVLLKLQMVGLQSADAQKMPANLSGGMIKRVALARALSLEPDLLFLDEPTAGLDPLSAYSFVQLIRSLHEELGLTVIMVSHDVESVLGLSTHIAVLADKKVIINAPPDDVKKLDHPFIQDFFMTDH